jgi:hypothetical protein
MPAIGRIDFKADDGFITMPACEPCIFRLPHGATLGSEHLWDRRQLLLAGAGAAISTKIPATPMIPLAIAGMRRAMAAGARVLGYVHWSLLDNFEWLFGFGPKYGLVEVDSETFKRKVKPSARVYANTVKAGSKPIHG